MNIEVPAEIGDISQEANANASVPPIEQVHTLLCICSIFFCIHDANVTLQIIVLNCLKSKIRNTNSSIVVCC
jgi:hypothetical protein